MRHRAPTRPAGEGRTWLIATVLVGIAITIVVVASPRPGGSSGAGTGVLPYGLDRLRGIQAALPEPGSMDWLAHHDEPGQTFGAWLREDPVTPTGARSVLYVQPIGAFTADERRVLDLTVEYMVLYFSREVRLLPDLPLDEIPDRARRLHPEWGDEQILSTYVLDRVLGPTLPADAAAAIAFTAIDLWPGDGWNFVFGQASLVDRVGVWSMYRNGDPAEGTAAFQICLRRTLKTATHETSHMFSLRHCTAYLCNMNGSNNRAEADHQPLLCCPECLAKVCHATGANPLERYRVLEVFLEKQGLQSDLAQVQASIEALDARGP